MGKPPKGGFFNGKINTIEGESQYLEIENPVLGRFVNKTADLVLERHGLKSIESVAIGLNGDRHSAMDGEPHLVLFLKKKDVSFKRLEKFALELGP